MDAVHRHKATNSRVFVSVVRGTDSEGRDIDILVNAPPGTTLFDGDSERRARAEYWWICLTIGSTLIPSVLHVAIAAFAGLCSIAPRAWVDTHLPGKRAPLETDW